MKFHKQLCRHSPSKGSYGDCFRTALACILDKEPEEVPHFLEIYYEPNSERSPTMDGALKAWLGLQGLAFIDIAFAIPEGETMQSALDYVQKLNGEDIVYLVVGNSLTGPHCCIYRGNKLLWDPGYSNRGIISEIEGVVWLTFVTTLDLGRYSP